MINNYKMVIKVSYELEVSEFDVKLLLDNMGIDEDPGILEVSEAVEKEFNKDYIDMVPQAQLIFDDTYSYGELCGRPQITIEEVT